MPVYIYQNPRSKEYIEIVQSVNEIHEYIDKNGLKWNRIFTPPELNTGGTLKADCSAKEFSDFTRNHKGTVGDLWDRSAELSEKRKKIYGEDPIKNKHKLEWSKKRKNKKFIE